jgi:hypothetical protein
MLLIRNVFRCKPGRATALVKMFKEMTSKSQAAGTMTNARVLTDVASDFWTVVFETEAESLEAWERQFQTMSAGGARADLRKPMEGYMDLVDGGYREIFRIE